MIHPRRAALVGALSLLLAGCGGDTPETSAGTPLTPPSIAPVPALPTVSAGAARALPLMAYRYTDEQSVTLARAEGLIVQQCMRRLGFTNWQPGAIPPPAASWTTGLPLGIVDAEHAARYGYHAPDVFEQARDPGRESTAGERMERAVLLGDSTIGDISGKGVPEGGCHGEAIRKLNEGGPDADRELDGRLGLQAGDATEADPRVTAAIAAWSSCMAAAGHRYRTPMEASGQEWAPTPTAAERAVATADVRCKRETRLAEIWFTVQSGYESQLIARNREALDAGRAQIDAEIRRAAEVLASGG